MRYNSRLYMDEMPAEGGDASGGGAGAAPADSGFDLDKALGETLDKAAGELKLPTGDSPADAGGSPKQPEGSAAPDGAEVTPAAPEEPAQPDKFAAPPSSWRPEMKEKFGQLPAEVRAYVHEREQQMLSGVQQLQETARYGQSLQKVFEPYQPLLVAQGVRDPAQAVQFLLNAHARLSQGDETARAQAFATIAKSYNIDLAKVTAAAPDEPGYRDPATKEALERLQRVESRLTADEQQRQQAFAAEKQAEVEAFAADPKHKYFDEVADDIVLQLQKPGVTLQQAYDRAVWANPVVREKQLSEARREAEAAALAKAKAEAEKAAKARGTRIRGDERHRDTPDPVGTMEQTLSETLSTIKSRT